MKQCSFEVWSNNPKELLASDYQPRQCERDAACGQNYCGAHAGLMRLYCKSKKENEETVYDLPKSSAH